MITIYHLGVSQSDRIVWLMEELNLPYHLEWFDRGEDGLATDEYRALHPAATAPVIKDGDRVLTESAVILEYICHTYAGGKLTISPSESNYTDYLYWMHFNNNIQGLFFAKMSLQRSNVEMPDDHFVACREKVFYNYLDQRLGESDYLAGPEFTCADIMVIFNLTTLANFGGAAIDGLKNVQAYVARISERPAYIKAMAIAGPAATKPS